MPDPRPTPLDPAYLRALFDRNAATYDPVNRWISLGQVARWRRALVARADPPPAGRVLDAFSGPGSLGLACFRRVGPAGEVVFADLSPRMLAEAECRVRRRLAVAPGPAARFAQLDLAAGDEPPGAPFDIVLAGFALRYLEHPRDALAQLSEMLRPGGRLAVLEFTQPEPASFGVHALSAAAGRYFHGLLPHLAARLAGERELYDALDATSSTFWSPRELEDAVRAAGLDEVWREERIGGLVCLAGGRRPS